MVLVISTSPAFDILNRLNTIKTIKPYIKQNIIISSFFDKFKVTIAKNKIPIIAKEIPICFVILFFSLFIMTSPFNKFIY